MILLNDEQKKALAEWIAYALSKLKCEEKQIILLTKYINSLIKIDSTAEQMKSKLREFILDKTDNFVDELQGRLQSKDFTFTKELPKKAPPPKREEPKPKPQTQSASKPNTTNESKKEVKPAPNATKAKPESSNSVRKEDTTAKPSKPENYAAKAKPQQTPQQQQKQAPPQQKAQAKPQQSQQKPQQQTQQHSQPKQQAQYQKYNEKQQQEHVQHQQPNAQHQKPISQYNALFDKDDTNNDGEDEETQSDENNEKISEEKIETKNTESPKHYIIFIAGIDRNNSSIQTLYTKFTKYGRILAIEVNEDEKVAYIEFDELLSAFKAIKSHNKKNLFRNAYVQIDYAIRPDPEELEALESEYNKRKQLRQEKKQQILQQQLEQQKNEQDQASAEEKKDEEIFKEEQEMRLVITQKLKEAQQELQNCTDPATREELQNKIQIFQSMISDL